MSLARKLLIAFILSITTVVCAASRAPITPVSHVDLPRFMGQWYLLAAIPTSYGGNAYNAVESYILLPDGNIHTSFAFHEAAFDGPARHIESTGYVQPHTGNAVWGVRIFRIFRAQYIVGYLQPDYSAMIVARDKRDYVWIFARTPQIPETEYDHLVDQIHAMGYPLSKLRKVPQRWP